MSRLMHVSHILKQPGLLLIMQLCLHELHRKYLLQLLRCRDRLYFSFPLLIKLHIKFIHLNECCSPSMSVVTHFTVILRLLGMHLEWLDSPPFSLPLSLQQSNLKPQWREFQDQLTGCYMGSLWSTRWLTAMSESLKGAFQTAGKPEWLGLHSGWTG